MCARDCTGPNLATLPTGSRSLAHGRAASGPRIDLVIVPGAHGHRTCYLIAIAGRRAGEWARWYDLTDAIEMWSRTIAAYL